MATQPLGNPKFRAFDSNGNPLSGGLLYSYSAGTSTPLATYTTRAGDVANANPVVLDANGEASVWMTPGVLYKFELRTSAGVVQWTVDNFPSPADPDTTYDVATDPGGRLTLTSGSPTASASLDVFAATTVYYAPFRHNRIPIYNGTEWVLESFSELSQTTTDTTKSPAAVANSSVYDFFVWNDSGTIRLSRGPAWSSSTSRGTGAGTTEVTRLNGRLVNAVSISNGPAANRGTYVGSAYSNTSAQFRSAGTMRLLSQAYNQIPCYLGFSTDFGTYNYTTATARQANGNASYRVEVLDGFGGLTVEAQLTAAFRNTAASVQAAVSFGVDSTTTASLLSVGGGGETQVANLLVPVVASFSGPVGLGYHALNWIETSEASGTTTWVSNFGTSGIVTFAGIVGAVMA